MFIFSCWSLASDIYDKYRKTINWRLKKFALAYTLILGFSSNCDAVCQLKKLHIHKKLKILFFVYNVIFCCYISRMLQ